MAGADQTEVTRLLIQAADGDRRAADALLPLVYEQLRKIAQQRMALERPDNTLQATALVHEAYLRLVGDAEVHWQGRAHFFAAAAEAMRKILIDHARKRGRGKRGGQRQRIPLSVVDLAAEEQFDEILAVDDALRRLQEEDPPAAEVVRLRFFAGLSVAEVAAVLETSPRTVAREWAYARAWLYRELRRSER